MHVFFMHHSTCKRTPSAKTFGNQSRPSCISRPLRARRKEEGRVKAASHQKSQHACWSATRHTILRQHDTQSGEASPPPVDSTQAHHGFSALLQGWKKSCHRPACFGGWWTPTNPSWLAEASFAIVKSSNMPSKRGGVRRRKKGKRKKEIPWTPPIWRAFSILCKMCR